LRPETARAVLLVANASDTSASRSLEKLGTIDPGWTLQGLLPQSPRAPLARIADRPWWRAETETLAQLWRHAVATSCAARKIAQESGEVDPEIAGRLGLLVSLGLWAIAAEDTLLVGRLLAIRDPRRRADEERRILGRESSALGRDLAERLGLSSGCAEAIWLHADLANNLQQCASDHRSVNVIQKAYAWAERTPWALCPPATPDPGAADPRLRVLVAEVQIRCASGFVASDATPHEEQLTRSHAALLQRADQLEHEIAARDRFLKVLRRQPPGETIESWCDAAARAWCDEPGVTAARVVRPDDDAGDSAETRPATETIALGSPESPAAHLLVWRDAECTHLAMPDVVRDAWSAWAVHLADRDRLARRLEGSVLVHRRHIADDESQRPTAFLEALAEFAAGAGHELNNPLAVIVGRAQLLLSKAENPDLARSLRAIVTQGQRAHRMLRDLMFVARPPQPRLRPCQPLDVIRASVRDAQSEAEARGVRMVPELRDAGGWFMADAESIRHMSDSLLRNALEATPTGGTVGCSAEIANDCLSLSVRDTGRGLEATAARRLFDPFYSGRQAGRGLGMGLPRVGRVIERAGGELSWRSSLGHGSVFQVRLPLQRMPQAAAREKAAAGDA
jgi:signal transduction histidine kinase